MPSQGSAHITFSFTADNEDMKGQLRDLAQDIVSTITPQDADNSQELLSMFVSELFLSATQQSIHRERSRR